ncbi:hypothetical protein BD289DRAFT_142295 [Coniella lustricola]|uniref:Uncharacterized protein n=1 Tax=Coniella lustricola TaxID=2025994 RepID=A0A2T2ZVA1_9PEZI|nr:hypothetical protein BD289DRAFT_142295 [Coniella lustricola]
MLPMLLLLLLLLLLLTETRWLASHAGLGFVDWLMEVEVEGWAGQGRTGQGRAGKGLEKRGFLEPRKEARDGGGGGGGGGGRGRQRGQRGRGRHELPDGTAQRIKKTPSQAKASPQTLAARRTQQQQQQQQTARTTTATRRRRRSTEPSYHELLGLFWRSLKRQSTVRF